MARGRFDGLNCFLKYVLNRDWLGGIPFQSIHAKKTLAVLFKLKKNPTHMYQCFFLCCFSGWLLPQRKSYFSLRLPHDWYVFGLDNGLECDIDAQQTAYFARAAQALPPTAKVVVVTHDPNWVHDQYADSNSGSERG